MAYQAALRRFGRLNGRRAGLAATLFLLTHHDLPAAEITAAVAANFVEPARALARAFEDETGHRLTISFGSTGQLYTQITQGAPFDLFLAADRARPEKALEKGLAVAGSRFTYAIGRLVLFSADDDLIEGRGSLASGRFERLAIANPATAPYGAAAIETLEALQLHDALAERLVRGTNIAQTFQYVISGNAELGFVSLSQVIDIGEGSRWLVPRELHTPLAQDAVLLASSAPARDFLSFVASPEGRDIITAFGYGVPD